MNFLVIELKTHQAMELAFSAPAFHAPLRVKYGYSLDT